MTAPASTVVVTSRPWGIAPDGSAAQSFRIANRSLELHVLSFGARLASVHAPDQDGNVADVVLGYNSMEEYLEDTGFLGCSVGRYANRIANGRFALEGKTYELNVNDGPNTLHGGADGLWRRNWNGTVLENGVEFSVVSPDGDQGFPGTLSVSVRYTLEDSTLRIEYSATTDQPTVVNLTNHAYFNLAGEGTATVLDHEVQIDADAFTPIDATAIPLGENAPVVGTPFDFTSPHAIGERIREDDLQLQRGRGFDHNFVLREGGAALRRAAVAVHPGSGRTLQVDTTEPGVQFYTGNYLDGSRLGKTGSPYVWRSGFCLETQHFPDSPNQPGFPSTVLRPGEAFRSTTTLTFGLL